MPDSLYLIPPNLASLVLRSCSALSFPCAWIVFLSFLPKLLACLLIGGQHTESQDWAILKILLKRECGFLFHLFSLVVVFQFLIWIPDSQLLAGYIPMSAHKYLSQSWCVLNCYDLLCIGCDKPQACVFDSPSFTLANVPNPVEFFLQYEPKSVHFFTCFLLCV